MTKQQAKLLLDRYESAQASQQERLLVENWYASELHSQARQPMEEDYAKIKLEIWSNLSQSTTHRNHPYRKWLQIAAAVTALLGSILWGTLRYQESQLQQSAALRFTKDFEPGKTGATITMDDGSSILLSEDHDQVILNNGRLNYENGKEITEDIGRQLVASTQRGQTYAFTLGDGTKVWLNAASSIKFPSKFSDNERMVELDGEAYFEVAKNAEHPFIVKSNNQRIKVLGTHFNVSSYADEPLTRTSLLEGSVQVTNTEGRMLRLIPNQQSLSAKNSIKLNENIDVNDDVAWVKGDFVFRAATLENIMNELSRWYGVKLNYTDGVDKSLILGGYISRSKKLSEVLKMIELTKLVRFRLNDNGLTILPQ